jgi:hypothetical protein
MRADEIAGDECRKTDKAAGASTGLGNIKRRHT